MSETANALRPVEVDGVLAVEGPAGAPLLERAADVDRVIEACWATGCDAAVLYAENLPPAFFDLRSGEAGAILQKLRNYGVRLALVRPVEGAITTRFGELMAEARTGRDLGMFDTRDEARSWLAR